MYQIMNLFKRNVTAGVAALMIAATAALSSPAQAASNPAPAPVVTADPTTYVPLLVTEVSDSNIYYAPNQVINSSSVYAGMTWYVLGQDSTGQWVSLYVDPVTSVWVPKAVMSLSPSTALPIISTGS
jgi:hypothetical protein